MNYKKIIFVALSVVAIVVVVFLGAQMRQRALPDVTSHKGVKLVPIEGNSTSMEDFTRGMTRIATTTSVSVSR